MKLLLSLVICSLIALVRGQTGRKSGPAWTEWEDIPVRDAWFPIKPVDGYLFSLQTDIRGIRQGIRFFMRDDDPKSEDQYININIPINSEGLLLVGVPHCIVEKNIPFTNRVPGSNKMAWYFVKTATKFEVWCQGKMYHRQRFSDAPDADKCLTQMSSNITHVKFRPTIYENSKKIRYPTVAVLGPPGEAGRPGEVGERGQTGDKREPGENGSSGI